jgi:chromosome transmission fidelity protein 4
MSYFRYMLTSGAEGDVRVWEGIDDDDAVSHRIGEKVFAIAFRVGIKYIIHYMA